MKRPALKATDKNADVETRLNQLEANTAAVVKQIVNYNEAVADEQYISSMVNDGETTQTMMQLVYLVGQLCEDVAELKKQTKKSIKLSGRR